MQRALLYAAEKSGTLAAAYKQLADYYAARAKRLRKIKSRCYYPAFLLTLSLFLQPLPPLVAGSITASEYLQLSAGRLGLIIFAVYIALHLPAALSRWGLKPAIDRLQLQLPWVSGWVIKRQLNDFYLNLALLLAAGLSYAEALPKLVASIPNSGLRAQFRPALAKLNSGESVADILSTVDSIRDTTAIQIINSCEHSGSLAEGLQRFAELEAENLHLQDDMLAEWLPRLVYAGVVIWIASSILESNFLFRNSF
jgi:type II secretory pathway component PulF